MLFEENPTGTLLQFLILILSAVIIFLLYMERVNTSNIRKMVKDIDIPACPSCPKCPDCNLNQEGCPDCVCPDAKECPKLPSIPGCPKCPDVNTDCPACPSQNNVTADDIVDAIFPGRNKGLTTHGHYFPLDGLGEGAVEPAYSPITNLMPNYVGGDGVPASISFADQKLLNDSNNLSTQKERPIINSQGLFSERSKGDGVKKGMKTPMDSTKDMTTDDKATKDMATDDMTTEDMDTMETEPTASNSSGMLSSLSNLL